MDLDGQSCLVTGGASGLGYATARALIASGARVAIAGRRQDTLAAAAEALGAYPVVCDIADPDSVDNAISTVHQALGPLRVLVNCAADMRLGPLFDRSGQRTSLADFDSIVRTNLSGTFAVCQAFAASLRGEDPVDDDGQRGVIINVSSVGALDGAAGGAAYNASKAGMDALTLALARELAPIGIRVITIAPGPMETATHEKEIPPHIREVLDRTWVFPARPGKPSNFASLVVELCRNDHINGTIIRLDGGVRAPNFRQPT